MLFTCDLKISVSSFNHLFSLIKHFDIWIDLKMRILLSPDRKCFLWRCGLNTSFDLSLMSSSVYEQGGHYKHMHMLLYIYFREAWSPYCYRKELNFWIRQVNLKSNLSASNTRSLQRLHHLTLTCQAFKSDIFFLSHLILISIKLPVINPLFLQSLRSMFPFPVQR